jgi:phenylalanine-4-hydroxylase
MLKQHYNLYTIDDHLVWSTLFQRQMTNLSSSATNSFLEGVSRVGFKQEAIPNFNEVDEQLLSLTGWQLTAVPGIMPNKEFFQLLNERKFPATTWIRKMSQLDYLEEPDMFHDVFGHVPLLSNNDFCNFLHGLSTIALEHIDDPYIVDLIGRVYWFTIEFGLIEEKGELKIYGAGIASSAGETKHALGNSTTKTAFDIELMVDTPYRNDIMQDQYFVIKSFEQLYQSLAELASALVDRRSSRVA